MQLKPGLLVLIKADNSPVLCWPLGRILEVFPGQDGVVRVARVQTRGGELLRPAVKLCPLPNQANVVIFMSYFQKIFLGLSDEEIASAKYYYDKKAHPEKQLPMVFWLPFDDTVPPNYYFMAILNIYALVLTSILATGLISNTSAFSIHIRGQYTMLALQLERSTSASHLHDIIQKHQHLLHFRDKLAAVLANTCLLKAFIYNLTMTLSLYQLSSVKTVNQRAFQLIFQYVVILIMFYSFTTSSEVIDEGNDILYGAIRSYKWYSARHFDRRAAKTFQLLTRMCRKPMRLIYYGGTVDICYHSFLAVLKFSFSLFTILKQSIHAK
ncbi:hypothetical protein M8J77_020242 [Diaphorina citri]|nr:hypothetical protein M8J77_020242 [Diaphorina citri]